MYYSHFLAPFQGNLLNQPSGTSEYMVLDTEVSFLSKLEHVGKRTKCTGLTFKV